MKSTPDALELMGRYLDGQATAEETARLEALMMADAALRKMGFPFERQGENSTCTQRAELGGCAT